MTDSRADLARMMPDAFPVFFDGRQPYPSQAMVMPEVVRGANVLFAAPTASGKTEAVVAPLHQRHTSFRRSRLSTIYVAPTKALINDLHERLVAYLETRAPGQVARYTGDRHELRSAEGGFCLLATPEALDSLQLRHPELLASVRAIVIDEIHLLHGQPRGQQLRHVIARIQQAVRPPLDSRDTFQVVGMTATLDDMTAVAQTWLGPGARTIAHGAPRDIDMRMIDIGAAGDPDAGRARALARWLKAEAAEKVLVFSNSRNGAHALAAHLHRELQGKRWPVHLHFGALAAAERERVEEEMRTSRFGICVATTTLEIGIDIGDVDTVVLSDPPRSVSGFLQRIGRGNRRTGVCRVVALRASDEDERLLRALVDCGRRGELDDVHEYDRPSVRFQQVLSLCWRATRQDRSISIAGLRSEAGTDNHKPVLHDMIEMGCLIDVRGALVPSDRFMDEGDAGRIHTVIAGQAKRATIDMRTGQTAIEDADESTVGHAIFHDGAMRLLMPASEGGVYLGDHAEPLHTLARIRATGPALPLSRSVIWGLARQQGIDPLRWRLTSRELVTWGGETYNSLLAALLARRATRARFKVTPSTVAGSVGFPELSLQLLRDLARSTEEADDLPLEVAAKFVNPSHYHNELSSSLMAVEKRRAVPWAPFMRWLNQIEGIDSV